LRSDQRVSLLRRRIYSPALFSVTFEAPVLAGAIAPGQFVMLDLPGRIRPYLRRAYSVADADSESGEVEFLIRTVGPGTAGLESLAIGSQARLLGPLGNRFSLEGLAPSQRVAIVAGGIGAAPFPLLFKALARAGVAADFFLGGRNARDLSLSSRFDRIVPGETVLASDDGSTGEKGFITEAFRRRAERTRYARLFACGPMPMFAALAAIAAPLALPSQFSTEAAMGCGFGACLGCVIPGTDQSFLISCTEGPIFSPERIAWERVIG
jgi:dihydroorotate dehydrogenase electron transfer subunit